MTVLCSSLSGIIILSEDIVTISVGVMVLSQPRSCLNNRKFSANSQEKLTTLRESTLKKLKGKWDDVSETCCSSWLQTDVCL
jgi:hypothetical protein